MYLMHKDDMIAKLNIMNGKPYEVEEIYKADEMPFGTIGDIDFATQNIILWHCGRTIPYGRINLDKIEEKLGNVDDLSIKSYGLSLTDCYWYKPQNSNLSWQDVNFYNNGFQPDLLLLEEKLLDKQHISPDYTTNGVLKKFWMYHDGISFLIKAGGMNKGEKVLAANEVVAYKIANKLNFSSVPYEKLKIKDESFCVCPSFIKNDCEEFISARQIELQLNSHGDQWMLRNFLINNGFGKDLCNMTAFDVLMHNHDRHLDNFGIIRNPDTKEIIRFAPFFDNGSCLNWHDTDVGIENMKPFEKSLQKYTQQIMNAVLMPPVDELEEIVKEVYKEFQISEKQTQIAINELRNGYNIIQERNLELEELFEEKGLEESFNPADN